MNWHSESKTTKRERLASWHPWFAWKPVRIGERIYWLEMVERILFERVGTNFEGDRVNYYEPMYRMLTNKGQ